MMIEDRVRSEVQARNVIRKHAGLPLLNEEAEIRQGRLEERRRAYSALLRDHAGSLAKLRQQATAEFEEHHGRQPSTGLGWWAVYHRAQQRFEREIERRFGVTRPSG